MIVDKHIRWSDFKVGKKHRAFDMLEKIDDRIGIVFEKNGCTKTGLGRSLNVYNKKTGKVLVVDYWSPHLVVVRFKGCV